MKMSEKRDLDITTKIVAAAMQGSNIVPCSETGTDVAEFFKSIYDGIQSIETTYSVE